VEECGPCPVFASFTLAFALQLRKKNGKTSVRLIKTSVGVQYTYYQNTHTLQNPHKHTIDVFFQLLEMNLDFFA
jgi:predicted secreted Zn-dependent protease